MKAFEQFAATMRNASESGRQNFLSEIEAWLDQLRVTDSDGQELDPESDLFNETWDLLQDLATLANSVYDVAIVDPESL